MDRFQGFWWSLCTQVIIEGGTSPLPGEGRWQRHGLAPKSTAAGALLGSRSRVGEPRAPGPPTWRHVEAGTARH